MSIPTRKIGSANVSAVGFGAMVIAGAYGPVTEEEMFNVLNTAHATGSTLWDTADRYGGSEEILGKWFQRTGLRGDIFLCTKVGTVIENGKPAVNGKPDYIREAVEKCLRRLQVDYIDLLYLHRADTRTPIELSVGAMAEFVKTGKVRFLGLSEASANTLQRAHAVHPISAVQVEYSPFTLDIEDPKIAVLEVARSLGVSIVAYSPLGRGLLTGSYNSPADFGEKDHRLVIPKFSAANFPKILKIVGTLARLGAEKYNGASSSQVALAWLLAQGPDVIPIPGTKTIKYLRDNVAAASLQLTDEDNKAIRKLAEEAEIEGERYPPGHSQHLFCETPDF
ncbi:Aldo-ket-red domain-containing protein [Mycena indigotica]|uniref:Aldo-ket-red domain-containing protein n=1 Tax=Mycena indigotica TaxID=2126181 RepID=A0A8H6SR15_9AGAR|nr:Aldo-ket-red domain-containing protein [Mycena indigotica]KAF7303906.1 Aldo-ket-red domain-containing protein [Mycena indigotica]